ncbi:pyridoxamine 5'-phosphate oxidase family protein [Rudanella lutea]|uniref:pyridoxamine 5'-phosphate oxidase family protein n=1 Tax=Rudanella lutea TaxID=451374 RepID=UPI00036CC0A3|nr:pyridoxamine 5'-phosphate oxidase family protein [Rudanella lutea]
MDSPPKSTVSDTSVHTSLPQIEHTLWAQLASAPGEKENGFQTFTLVTTSDDGPPDARMVVLRQADTERRVLWFHTDRRAQKVAQLRVHPVATLLFWDRTTQVQLRCRVKAQLHTDDEAADAQWAATWEGSRKMYLSEREPGSPQPEPYPGFPRELGERLPTREESEAGRPNFAAVACTVLSIDYLNLGRAGQTRARFSYDGAPEAIWVVP